MSRINYFEPFMRALKEHIKDLGRVTGERIKGFFKDLKSRRESDD